MRFLNHLVLAVLAVLLVGSILSLVDVLLHRSDYVFGTEVAGLSHRSAGLYLGTLLLETVVLSTALVLSHRTKNPASCMLIRAAVILVYLGLMAVAIGTG